MTPDIATIAAGLSEACGNCRFARSLPEPGERPVIADAPDRYGFWGWLLGREDIFDQLRRTGPLRRWQTRAAEFESEVVCHRFPETQRKAKSDVCGEFSPVSQEFTS
jgi:hypothetical protein